MRKLRYNPCMTILRVCFFVFLVGVLAAQEKAAPPTQKLIFENEFVRVLDMHYAPGVSEAMHSHARGVTIAMSDYDNETKTADGKVNKGHVKFGRVGWAEPVTHEAHNTGTTEQHVVRIDIKRKLDA